MQFTDPCRTIIVEPVEIPVEPDGEPASEPEPAAEPEPAEAVIERSSWCSRARSNSSSDSGDMG